MGIDSSRIDGKSFENLQESEIITTFATSLGRYTP
jgi:hypothetical protein